MEAIGCGSKGLGVDGRDWVWMEGTGCGWKGLGVDRRDWM